MNSILFTREVATSADGIALDTFGPAGAQAAVSLFALLGFAQLMLPLLGWVVLIRYRAMIPLFYLFLLIQQLGAKLVLIYRPMSRSGGEAGSVLVLALLVVTVAGFLLSLWAKPGASGQDRIA
ncbi:MAG TPA: hypothetical protein VGH15_10135 [Caulobacteraceae bacterium]